jgi:hypothetical protein
LDRSAHNIELEFRQRNGGMLAPQHGSSAFTKPKIKIKIKFLKKGEKILTKHKLKSCKIKIKLKKEDQKTDGEKCTILAVVP